MLRRLPALLTALVVVAAGCSLSEKPAEDVSETGPNDARIPGDTDEAISADSIVSDVGTVRYVDLEGGFYGIVADSDSTRYNPMNLAEEYREDGLRIRFRGTVRDDVMSVQMWGKNLQLEDVERLSFDQ